MPVGKKTGLQRVREVSIIEGIADTLESVRRLSDDSDNFSCFRGQGSIAWLPSPSIFRRTLRLANSEYMMIRELVSRYPEHFNNDRTMFDRLVRMQHFGLPTRLMDVTSNPLVALYFAVSEQDASDGAVIVFRVGAETKKYYDSDSISAVCNLANLTGHEKETIENTPASTISSFMRLQPAQRLYQFIREEKPHFRPEIKKDDLFKQFYVVPKRNNARIIAQNGAFLAFGLKWSDGSSFGSDIQAFSLRIPASAKPNIKRELAMIGIDGGALFPEIDRAAAQIAESYL